jgi:hypothetical protein
VLRSPRPRHCEARARGWNPTERRTLQARCSLGQARPRKRRGNPEDLPPQLHPCVILSAAKNPGVLGTSFPGFFAALRMTQGCGIGGMNPGVDGAIRFFASLRMTQKASLRGAKRRGNPEDLPRRTRACEVLHPPALRATPFEGGQGRCPFPALTYSYRSHLSYMSYWTFLAKENTPGHRQPGGATRTREWCEPLRTAHHHRLPAAVPSAPLLVVRLFEGPAVLVGAVGPVVGLLHGFASSLPVNRSLVGVPAEPAAGHVRGRAQVADQRRVVGALGEADGVLARSRTQSAKFSQWALFMSASSTPVDLLRLAGRCLGRRDDLVAFAVGEQRALECRRRRSRGVSAWDDVAVPAPGS